ncbi:DJ-1/PfpI family protein [Acinetobacter sp. WU_MDCI_Axc73]|nr:DJ-1/PfpI family protein [Acinetobacter sp. WU_MDCI_Axc73]
MSNVKKLKVGILISPDVALMDLFGVHAVFGMAENFDIHIIWKNQSLINGTPHFPIAADTTFDKCPPLDILVVGAVPPHVLGDDEVIQFIAQQAKHDPFIISVCAGILLLGAAGLLGGKKVTTNFHIIDQLESFGAIPIHGGHVEIDDKLYSVGPATGGFEAAIMLLAKLRGDEAAKLIELTIEYHPKPPFHVGTPELAGTALTSQAKNIYKDFFSACTQAAFEQYQKHQ